ncbi:HAD family hydrolase [Sphingobacterium tabacisoli]|uniref:HAD family hydrolase n=1 Tax=Sphingobacterium tabacisoli TaxID=2044855 RepID=A0ABW5KY61_9SPHI|nr:HAD family hydrolase [Sphingobacterium tabacisoli]
MKLSELSLDKSLYLFELDDVLFSKREYLLQVYYLFGSFYEFTEGSVKASEMAGFMKKVYDHHGETAVFPAIQTLYGIDSKYEDNFNRLIANAQIPLRLLIPHPVTELLLRLVEGQKQIAILTKGNPVEQLNKLRFIEWGESDKVKESLKVYFVDELEFKSFNPIDYIAEEYRLPKDQILIINEIIEN